MNDLEKVFGKTKFTYLLNFENMLDQYDIYAFKNWFNGKLYLGPKIGKYVVKICLKYDYYEMPCIYGALRLKDLGIRIKYILTREENKRINLNVGKIDLKQNEQNNDNLGGIKKVSMDDLNDIENTNNKKTLGKKIWVLDFEIPKNLLDFNFNIDLCL